MAGTVRARRRTWRAARGPWPLALLLLLAAPAAARPGPHEEVLEPADSLAARGQPEKAAAYADSLLRLARARGDRALEAVVASRRVLNWVAAGRLEEGAREAARVATLAREVRDTLSWGRALLAHGRAELFRERLAEAGPPYRRLLPLARAAGDPALEGNARLGLAYLDLRANRAARAETGYRRALALLERSRDTRGEMAARVGLARVLTGRGRVDEARRSYRAILERCRATGDRLNEADAWNNLGAIEAAAGDPALAASHYARAIEVSRGLRRANPGEVRNLAVLLVESGRVEAAGETLVVALARWPRGAWRETYGLRTQLATVRGLQGRRAECERMLREQWALRDSVPLDAAAEAAVRLVETLIVDGRDAEARALALELDALGAGRLPHRIEVSRVVQLARLEAKAGRAAEALARLRRLSASGGPAAAGSWRERVALELQYSRVFHALGRPDSAIAAIRRAGDLWERTASGIRAAEWYEPIGNSAAQLAVQAARVLLDPRRALPEARRVREAFDALQRYKSRALEWRVAAPAAGGAGLVDAATLQQRVLGPGDVLLDSYSSLTDSTVVFVLTRASLRAYWVPAGGEADEALVRAVSLLHSADEASAPFHAAASRRLATDVFGPALESLQRARRVFFSASGLLGTIPLAALIVDPESGAPLLEGRTVVAVPSASWLARASRAGAPRVASARVVTVARTTDERGRALAGVRDEARWLAGRYGGAGLVHAGDQPLSAVVPWLERGDILHVSSHARASSPDPWGSAFLLGRGEDEGAWLSARAIAGRRPTARIAVLASCRTTLDRGYSNESVLGLSRAFLAAGVPAVLSTLWPVDDRATADFTRRFYLGLEAGRGAGEALREAQLATRRVPATAAPYHWAGFVLSGNPDTRAIPRRPR